MKKLILATGIILISCVFMDTIFAPPAAADVQVAQTAAQTEAVERYWIKDSDGKIAIYTDGEDKPFFVTETYTNSLPKADAERLRRGIRADDKAQLQKIIEDYCS